MQNRHRNRRKYFKEQAYTTFKYIIPFISQYKTINENVRVLEIGCGEGGNLKPFLDKGCKVTGIDLSSGKIENARTFLSDHPQKDNLVLIHKDIYKVEEDFKFDIIIMRDVLEHIHNQEKFMRFVKKFMKKDSIFFLGFPPWQNPFGGHQQVCNNKLLSIMPYFHILPTKIYLGVLKLFGESESLIKSLQEIKDTHITIERFHKILKEEKYSIIKRAFYLINPNYEVKFKLRPVKQVSLINKTPWLRNFFITTCYYLISR